jgi:hypothetical protein
MPGVRSPVSLPISKKTETAPNSSTGSGPACSHARTASSFFFQGNSRISVPETSPCHAMAKQNGELDLRRDLAMDQQGAAHEVSGCVGPLTSCAALDAGLREHDFCVRIDASVECVRFTKDRETCGRERWHGRRRRRPCHNRAIRSRHLFLTLLLAWPSPPPPRSRNGDFDFENLQRVAADTQLFHELRMLPAGT